MFKFKRPLSLFLPGHFLRAASIPEIEIIRKAFRERAGSMSGGYISKYEGEITNTKSGFSIMPSDNPEDQRYWVIAGRAPDSGAINRGVKKLEAIARLTSIELDCSYVIKAYLGHLTFGSSLTHCTLPDLGEPPQIFDEKECKLIAEFHEKMERIAGQHPEINRSIEKYYQLRSIPRYHSLYILGVFGVIESLITHDPKGRYDSLNRQIQTKMTLLDKRFEGPVDRSSFKEGNFKTLWTKLYDYRSILAHGGEPDFNKDMKMLQRPNIVVDFLDQVAKKLLIHALGEPDLVLDLQKC